MLYLEDYLEMIEHLPQQIKTRCNEIREMDISVQTNMGELDKRVKQFFNECKKFTSSELPESIESEYQAIRQEYNKSFEDTDEKVQLASQMSELVERFIRQLDVEIYKFKCELEADNKGITEILEKRSMELDQPASAAAAAPSVTSQQKENRFENNSSTFRYSRPPRGEKRKETSSVQVPFAEKRQALAPSSLMESRHLAAVTPAQAAPSTQNQTANVASYNLGHIGAGQAIASAASQAIAATQQMQQGRRTASLKASYEAINTGGHGHEFSIGRELAGAAQTAIQAIQQDNANNKKKQKKWSSSTSGVGASSSSATVQAILNNPIVPAPESPSVDIAQNADITDGEWTYDPNEPRYCLCNQVSYGDMVACDNEDCPSEWFHYPCVGISAPPKGKWYCPQCTQSLKRRGSRK